MENGSDSLRQCIEEALDARVKECPGGCSMELFDYLVRPINDKLRERLNQNMLKITELFPVIECELNNPDIRIKVMAANLVEQARIDPDLAVLMFKKVLPSLPDKKQDPYNSGTIAIVNAFADFGSAADPAVPDLLQLAEKDPPSQIIFAIGRVLEKIGTQSALEARAKVRKIENRKGLLSILIGVIRLPLLPFLYLWPYLLLFLPLIIDFRKRNRKRLNDVLI